MIMKKAEVARVISELVDIIALEKPVDFESIDYASIRDLSVLSAMEQIDSVMTNAELADTDKYTSLTAILAYMMVENTTLWVETLRQKR